MSSSETHCPPHQDHPYICRNVSSTLHLPSLWLAGSAGIGNDLPRVVQGREVEGLDLSLTLVYPTQGSQSFPAFVTDMLCDAEQVSTPLWASVFSVLSLTF